MHCGRCFACCSVHVTTAAVAPLGVPRWKQRLLEQRRPGREEAGELGRRLTSPLRPRKPCNRHGKFLVSRF